MGFGPFSSESRTTNTTRTQNAAFSELSGSNAVAIEGEGNTISLSDFGAIGAARDIASQAFDQVELSGKSAAETVSRAVAAVSESNREESENIVNNVKTVAILGVITWGAVQIFKRFA